MNSPVKKPDVFDWYELITGILLLLCGLTAFLPTVMDGRLVRLYGFLSVLIGAGNIFLYQRYPMQGTARSRIALAGAVLSVLPGFVLMLRAGISLYAAAILCALWLTAFSLTEAELHHRRYGTGRNLFRIAGAANRFGTVLGLVMIPVAGASLPFCRFLLGIALTVLGCCRCVFAARELCHKPG